MWRPRSMLTSIVHSLAALGLFGACAPMMRAVETPIPLRVYGDVTQADEVFILLPGLRDDIDSFEERGFLAVTQEILDRRNDIAFIAVDAHYGYYRERSIERRLKDEVLGQFAGKKVTAVGISMGGFGALVTARRHPDLFDRLVMIAPFLGWPENIQQLKHGADAKPRDEMETKVFALWLWLEQGAAGIPTTLLFGRDDRFRKAYDHLASRAPAITQRRIEGAHDWPTWNALWADWLRGHTAIAEAALPPQQFPMQGAR